MTKNKKWTFAGATAMVTTMGLMLSPTATTYAASNHVKQTSPLVVYANDFNADIGPMFEKATGYKIKVVQGSGSDILSRVQAEQGNPQWDVIWMDDEPSMYQLDQQGMFETGWKPNDLSNLTKTGASYVPKNDAYFPTDVGAAAVIAYNTKDVSAKDAPKTWAQLLSYNGKIGMADPGVAAPAYPVVSWLFHTYGVQNEENVFANLFSQSKLNVYPKNGPLATALTDGDIQVAALQAANAYDLKAQDAPIGIVWPTEGVPGAVRVVGIRKNDPNAAVAKAFVEFLLKTQTEQQLTQVTDDDASYFTPLVKGVTPRSGYPTNPKIGVTPVAWAANHETSIKTWFANQEAH